MKNMSRFLEAGDGPNYPESKDLVSRVTKLEKQMQNLHVNRNEEMKAVAI